MSPAAVLVYLMIILIWGSSWFVIRFQTGEVEPLIGVVYRFALGSLILMVWCSLSGARLRLRASEHRWLALQGICLFGLNYWLMYESTRYLTSGVVATLFANFVVFNLINGRIFLKRPVSRDMALGAITGVAGVVALFWPEVSQLSLRDSAMTGLVLTLAATWLASLGSIAATRNLQYRLPATSANAWGMFYGALMLTAIALIRGETFSWPGTQAFTLSLLYLSVVASVLCFGALLWLIAEVGPERAGYTATVIPVVALSISSLLEGYQWTTQGMIGLLMIISGNVMISRMRTSVT